VDVHKGIGGPAHVDTCGQGDDHLPMPSHKQKAESIFGG